LFALSFLAASAFVPTPKTIAATVTKVKILVFMIFKVIECQLFNSSFYQITTIRRMPRKNVTAPNRLLDVRPDLFGERVILVGESFGVARGGYFV
jgi:hypothetical protein